MEVLLGEKPVSDVVGLAEMLANRRAYLIADSINERATTIRGFKELYDVRSRIAHGGKSTLSAEEHGKLWELWELRSTCMRVIQREVALLEKDVIDA